MSAPPIEVDPLGRGGGHGSPRAALVPIAMAFGLGLAAAGAASGKAALLGVGLLLGVVGLASIVRFAPARATDAVFMLLVGLVTAPVDSFLGYQDHVGGWPGIRVAASDVALVLGVALALLGRIVHRVASPIPARVAMLCALLLVCYGLSSAMAARRDLALFEVVSTLHAFAIAWVVAALFRRDHLSWIIALLALQVIAHSGFAVTQGITGRPIGAGWLGGDAELLIEVLEGGEGRVRPAGLMPHPIVYATSLVLFLPLLGAGLAACRSKLARMLAALGLALGLVGLLLTLSRGAWLSSLLAFALLGALALRCRLLGARQLRAIVVTLALAGLVLGVAFGPRVYARLTRSATGNVGVRFDLNRIALRMTADHPFFGTGLNNFVETMAAYDPKDVMEYFPAPAHNLYLLESAEAGVPALVLWLALFGTILLGGLHHLPRMNEPALAWIVAACVAGLAGFLVSQLADFSHRLEPLRSLVWLTVGLLFGALQENRGQRLARGENAA